MPPKSKGRFTSLTSWSFSVFTQYMKCPFSVCLDKIQRVKIIEAPNIHFEKGNKAHGIAEQFIGGKGKAPVLTTEVRVGGEKATVDLKPIKDQLVQLRKRGEEVAVEQEWAFDKQWRPCDWRDWDRAWLRIKTDVCGSTVNPPTVDIIDWKTGKVHADDHKLQRRLYALGGLILVSEGALAGGSKDVKLTAQHVYVDTGQQATEEFLFKQLAPLKREWLARIKYMVEDTVFAAKPGYTCKYCKFNKKNGGPCKDGL